MTAPASTPRSGGASRVFSGILLSRILGLLRQRLFGHWFGDGEAADAVNAAMRIPNFLQNLFGEGVLSASFIPVYARLLAEGRKEEAGRVAGAIGALLALATAVMVLAGIAVAPWLIAFIAPGFTGEKRDLTVLLVRVMFPGVGLLVWSAWCLGVLNSHRRFFLAYAAPIAWNLVLIGALVVAGPRQEEAPLAVTFALASVAGAFLQFAVQLPAVLRLDRALRFELGLSLAPVRDVLRSFTPVLVGRGVVQLSGYIDNALASLMGTGAVAMLNYAQPITMLPVSLFGMAVSAAELPAMASVSADAEGAVVLRERLAAGLRRISFYVIPSAVAFLVLGDVVGGALYRTGRFGSEQVLWLWTVLAGSAVGLVAGTLGRLYASTCYALRDTRTPLRFALIRVTLTLILGWLGAIVLPRWLGIDAKWGVAGLTASAGLAAWVEFALLRRALAARIGAVARVRGEVALLWALALGAAGLAFGAKVMLGAMPAWVLAAVVLPVFAVTYVAGAWRAGVPAATELTHRLRRRPGVR
ncbi:MAG: murein biosynthesis integral membrane protein MurJ [Gemmatimonadaceae bacterium]|nr:murein biosynthesis integral membrane protein MurJ [Gemmatimonadaceae bacterium]